MLFRSRTIGVLDELFTKVSEEDLLDEPGMQGLRRDLLERALPHYKAFLAESQGNSKLADKVAATWFRIGRIRESSGDVQGAVEAFEEARLLQEKLIKEPSTSQRKEELVSQREGALGDTLNAFGKLRSKQNNTLDAMKLFEESYAYREKRAKQSPRNLDLQRAECNTLMNLGLSYVANEDTGNGLERIARAQRRREELLSEFPKSDKLLQEIAEGWYTLGKVTMARGDIEQTNSYLSKSTDAFEELYQLNKTSLRIQSEYGVALRLLGVTYCEQGEPDRALEFLKRAVPLTQRLEIGRAHV